MTTLQLTPYQKRLTRALIQARIDTLRGQFRRLWEEGDSAPTRKARNKVAKEFNALNLLMQQVL